MLSVVALSLGLAVLLSYLVLEFPRVSISGAIQTRGDILPNWLSLVTADIKPPDTPAL
jgi:hypothetical protein